MMSTPAFTTVATRRSLHPAPSSSPSKPPRAPTTDWPISVRHYVQCCFDPANTVDGVLAEEMRAKLKEIINGITERGALHTHDWEKEELPQYAILRARQNLPGAFISSQLTNTRNGKKRASPDADLERNDIDAKEPLTSLPQGRSPNAFENRVTYETPAQAKKMNKRQRRALEETPLSMDTSKLQSDLEKRRLRFEDGQVGATPWRSARAKSPVPLPSGGAVIGTCQELEKRYFRLTAPPKPETVRPLPVLRKTLDLLKKKWRTESNYGYICDQLKSLRQDLTVQHIKNDFTVNVYEIHARIALEKGDLGEYNQCQTQLRALYKQKLGGHPGEFMAYRILYFIYTCNRTDMNSALADLTSADHQEPAVKHALQTRSALALGNYHRFFKLYMTTPNMGAYLMDMFIARERLAAMASICKSYKPDVPFDFVSDELAFDEREQCCQFLCDHGGENMFETRSDGRIMFLASKAGVTFDAAKGAAFRTVDIKGQI